MTKTTNNKKYGNPIFHEKGNPAKGSLANTSFLSYLYIPTKVVYRKPHCSIAINLRPLSISIKPSPSPSVDYFKPLLAH